MKKAIIMFISILVLVGCSGVEKATKVAVNFKPDEIQKGDKKIFINNINTSGSSFYFINDTTIYTLIDEKKGKDKTPELEGNIEIDYLRLKELAVKEKKYSDEDAKMLQDSIIENGTKNQWFIPVNSADEAEYNLKIELKRFCAIAEGLTYKTLEEFEVNILDKKLNSVTKLTPVLLGGKIGSLQKNEIHSALIRYIFLKLGEGSKEITNTAITVKDYNYENIKVYESNKEAYLKYYKTFSMSRVEEKGRMSYNIKVDWNRFFEADVK